MSVEILRLGPGDSLSAVARAQAERVLILDPALELPEGALDAHDTEGIAVGGARWPESTVPSTLSAYLDDGEALLGHRGVRVGDRVYRESFRHVSLPRAVLRLVAGLPPRWQRIAAWRALLIDGQRPRRVAAEATWAVAPRSEAQHLDLLERFASDAPAAYAIDPELLPRATRRYGPMLPPAPGPARMARIAAFDLLGRATSGVIDTALLDRLEDRLLFDAFSAALQESAADEDFLPTAYAAAMSLRREDPQAAAQALAALVPRSPLVCGVRRVRVLLEAGDHDAAAPAAAELLGEPSAAAFARPHLLAGEIALAVGELDRAEAHFADAYAAAERPIETAARVGALFARYGPAPAARAHLERIADDAEDRSAMDHRTLIAPALERLSQLP